jgi:hypothetical protein
MTRGTHMPRHLFISMIGLIAILHLSSGVGRAAEGGMGEYALGFLAPQAGYLPDPGTYFGYNFYLYSGGANIQANRQILGGHGSIDVKASLDTSLTGHLFTLTHVFEHPVLGGNAGVGLTIPYILADLKVTATGNITLPNTVIPVSGSKGFGEDAQGDAILTPMIGWHQKPLHYIALVNLYVPTGKYNDKDLVNTGHNHWAIEPMFNTTYLNETYGTELSEALGVTFNTQNAATHYTTGIESHLDVAAIQHFSQYVYVGGVWYGYYQLTGDYGSGATLGDFKGRIFGGGPVLGGMIPLGQHKLYTNARYYHEWGARNRLEGSTIFITASVDF